MDTQLSRPFPLLAPSSLLLTFSSIVKLARLLSFGVATPAVLPMGFMFGLGVEMSRLVMDEDDEKGAGEGTGVGTATEDETFGDTRGRLKDGLSAIATSEGYESGLKEV